jgi:formate dehydrogenase gamma subunit
MLTTRQLITTLVAAAGLVWTVATAWTAEAPKDSDCLLCHEDKTLAKTNATGQVKSLYVDAARLKVSTHSTNTCASCHRDVTDKHPDDNVVPKPVTCANCHERLSERYNASVHALALKAGDAAAPTCRDCHGAHEILPPTNPASPLYPSNLSQTCGVCHDQVAAAVQASVHGQGTAAGKREAATCIDCHSEHAIEQLKTNATLRVSAEVCSRCHASERINTKFNLPKDRVQTFFESYHGLASQYGSTLAANCASCHGYHLVLRSADPKSSINTNNLVATCGKCHPGATQNFTSGKIHVTGVPGKAIGEVINFWVRRIYLILIFGTIGFMLAHNGILWLRKIAKYYRDGTRTILRMDLCQRWQHFLLVGSFIALAVTGFALKWPESWIAKLLGSHEDFRRWSHRVAGIIILALGVYHVFYLIFSRNGRQLFKDFLPVKKDAADLVQTTRYLVGHTNERPKIGRFGYAEKMEYWAVAWGTIIMGVTGLVIWFKIDVTQFLPRWIVEVATTIHYYEAILACLAIIVWHFYHVMLDPDVYPVNFAFWDGKVSKHWQEEEHPLDNSVPGAQMPAETSSTPTPGPDRPTNLAEPKS